MVLGARRDVGLGLTRGKGTGTGMGIALAVAADGLLFAGYAATPLSAKLDCLNGSTEELYKEGS